MKKTTTFLVTLFTLLCSMVANAQSEPVTFNVMVDDPATVKCEVSYQETPLVAGLNTFTIDPYNQISFTGVNPYYIDKVTNEAGTPQDIYNGKWYKTVYPDDNGKTYTIEVINLNDSRESEFTLNVDDPSLITAELSGWNQKLTLQPGKNTVKFNAEKENELSISKADYNKDIYEVKLDGQVQPSEWGYYTLALTPDCVVDVTAIIPDIDVTVSINYSEEGKGAIQGVKVDGVAIEDFDGTTVKMKAGQKLTLVPNKAYKFEEVKFNGEVDYWKGSYDYDKTVLSDLVIDINAHPYSTFDVTVKIDNPENITLYRGSTWNNDIIPLTAGENTITFQENNTTMSWKAASDALIQSATADGNALDIDYGSTEVKDGMVIEFVTAKIVFDKTAVVWVDDQSIVNYFNVVAGEQARVTLELNNGYNVIPFYEKMTPFSVSSWPGALGVYLDGEKLSPSYTGGSSYTAPVADNSVVKVFLASEPETCTVSFDVAEGVEATVKYDILKTLESLAEDFTCFKGTQIAIAGDEALTVKVNDTDLAKDEEGNYVFTVEDAATTVTLASSTVTSIDNVTVNADNTDNTVYNLMGVKLGNRSDLNKLPKGVYIVNGQKVVNK